MTSAPTYVCWTHSQPLTQHGSEARCPECAAPYPIHENIWMLDIANRPDKGAFDEQVLYNRIPLDLDKANKLLAAAHIEALDDANILDVGCGLGDLTQGLAHSHLICNSRVFAFDHSVQSLREAAAVTEPHNGNSVHYSAQDAFNLFFPDAFFDLVAGSAVLHHFHDVPKFFHELARVLKPGAKAVFGEPFFDGYFWPSLFLKNALEEHGVGLHDVAAGQASVIIGLVDFMSRHRGTHPELEHFTDKHFFRESELSAAATEAGFRSSRYVNTARPAFYRTWMPHFLDTYGVAHAEVRRSAIAQYEAASALAGPLLPELMSHFKYITLQKAF